MFPVAAQPSTKFNSMQRTEQECTQIRRIGGYSDAKPLMGAVKMFEVVTDLEPFDLYATGLKVVEVPTLAEALPDIEIYF